MLKLGTRSLLFGAHQFIIHPLMVALAWHQLYGPPRDLRLWVCFFIHDLGYWGKAGLEDAEGKSHPELGAKIATRLFGNAWGDFCRGHSRSYAKTSGVHTSRLCAADKLGGALEPWWLYLPRVYGKEVDHYMSFHKKHLSRRLWHQQMQENMRQWAYQHASECAPEPGVK